MEGERERERGEDMQQRITGRNQTKRVAAVTTVWYALCPVSPPMKYWCFIYIWVETNQWKGHPDLWESIVEI